ncbi:tigger transposable element-derived protein 4-like [Anthonomus grandis grandis]|uniref:tigger transposable element-derived protein 4-like n=1 Tax=Anthonomus grandis grandis TaxID=2921223 RepID=UPI0021655033|nr:tigger transposable element-derived protein 4-like [Anthonomus grandis grandis]
MASVSKKRKVLSIEEKGLIIARLESGESNATVATEFDLSHSSVSTILKNKNKIKEAFNENLLGKKKLKLSQHPDIDQALLKWFKSQRSGGTPISGPILQAKANNFGRIMGKVDLKCSESWIKRFRQRHKIVFGKISGGAASAPQGVRENWLTTVWAELRKGYKDVEIYNADETGLFYKLTPDKTLRFKGETCTGGKLSKERITVLVATNMTGSDKPKLIVIGKSRNPRCFKHIKTLPVVYKSNKKTWMTSGLFVSILHEWDAKLVKTKKKILLL